MSKKVKIELKCRFGTKGPGDVIEVDEKQATSMIATGSAIEAVDRKVGESKAEVALGKKVAGLESSVTDLEAKLKASEESVVAEKAKVTDLEAKLKAKKQ